MSTYRTGTVSVTNGSAVIAGSGTAWAVALVAGGMFSSAGIAVPIASVDSDTQITLDYEWPGITASGATYSIALENAAAASVVDLNTTLSRVLVTLSLAGIHPDASGTIAERDAISLGVGDKGFLFLHAEIGVGFAFYRWTGTAWEGPFAVQGATGPHGDPGIIGTWLGPWATATAYVVNDVVSEDGSSYICVTAHTSGTFAADLAAGKWEIVAQKGDVGAPGGVTSIAGLTGTVTAADARDALDTPAYVADRAALKALTVAKDTLVFLKEASREGWFRFSSSNLSSLVSADTREGLYIAPASDATGASGAWIRQRDNLDVQAKWFGQTGDAIVVTGNTSITSGTAALTVAGAAFATSDVGKLIIVPGAGAAGIPLVTTISARTSATQVTLGANAGTTLSAVSKTVTYGTDDATAINKAILALPTTGATCWLSGQSAIGSAIQVGNGSAAGSSTRWGIRLTGVSVGGGGNAGNGLHWLGAYNTSVIVSVNGPMNGWEVSSLFIDGKDSVQYGFLAQSAGQGRTDFLYIQNCRVAHYATICYATGTARNCEMIQGNNITIAMGSASGAIGILFDGRTDGAASSCFITLTTIRIYPQSVAVAKPIIFKVADTCTVNDLLIFHAAPANASTVNVTYDYSGNSVFPCGNILNGVDAGWNTPVAQQFANNGVSTGASSANLINNLTELNGCRYPTKLANVTLDLPRKYSEDVALTGQTAAIGFTTLHTPQYASRYRVNYLLAVTAVGTAGTVDLRIRWKDPNNVDRTQVVGTVTLTNAVGGNQISGSISVTTYLLAGTYIAYQTIHTGVTGSPQYSLDLSVERLN
ncbi:MULTISPECIES: carbohydrate-binding protein [unclassified Mesorhizobium]|uniref:carbohydrate-binding protein n=1 Tax=unclassified Mesorhizobium TaxID=325217 RepID=UPI0015E3CCCA|nr:MULTISPECIES: carbohydrate-binding protein [unclassified Mesorhizobium]